MNQKVGPVLGERDPHLPAVDVFDALLCLVHEVDRAIGLLALCDFVERDLGGQVDYQGLTVSNLGYQEDL
jgi:hypothetical protein